MKSILLFTFLSVAWMHSHVYAQLYTHQDFSIPVTANGKTLSFAWAGGLNSAQLSHIDLDGDGHDDLAVFDRTANKVFTFLSVGTQYTYHPEFEAYFPTDINEWMLLRDFNCDGKSDLFTSTTGGIKAYVNISSAGHPPKWRVFNSGNPVLTIGFSGSINIPVNATDIPALDDVDGDGDMDIVVSRFTFSGTFDFHRNMSIENLGHCDSMQFKRITTTWGNLQECNCGSYSFSGKPCTTSIGRIQHDVGKSLLILDVTGDGLADFLFSEQTCNSLYMFPNVGIPDSASFTTVQRFPTTTPSTILFPAAYHEDVDFDGVKDLVVSTNISARVSSAFDLSNSVLFYKNTGSNAAPNFVFQQSDFLQRNMIDAGSYSSPAFADYDHDGDQDLFVSYWATADTVSSILQFENIGTTSAPGFNLVTRDYLQTLSLGLYNIKIQFTDLDGDGKTDLVFTATDKKTFVTQLYYWKNQGTGAFDFSGSQPVPLGFTLQQYENIHVYDLNRDGLPDLLLGKADGSLQSYRNQGSLVFVINNSSYLGLSSSIERYCVSPWVTDIEGDGNPDLVLGNKGSIVVYHNFQSGSPQADSVTFYNISRKAYEQKSLSSYLSVTAADLYNTGLPEIFAGSITGGVMILHPDSVSLKTTENNVVLYPNPVPVNSSFFIRGTQDFTIQFISMLGQVMTNPQPIASHTATEIPQTLSPGLYLVRVSWSGGTQTLKLVVR